MGSLKELNDKMWKILLSITSNISDNVYIQILVITVLFTLLWFITSYIIQNKFNKILIPFGPISMLFCISIGYMIERLPMIHARLHRALSISSSVIESSKTYLTAFEHSANLSVSNSTDIVSHLYFMNEIEREAWKCNPMELYESLFRTFDKIRGGWILSDVHLPSFGTLSILFISCILLIFLMGFIVTISTNNKYRFVLYILQSIFLIYTTSVSNGAFVCAAILWMIEEIIYGILNIEIKNDT